ncbi:MAG: hypothetical protein DRH70_02785 [Candidatus Coatesbacteria bacterium]|nr:MAG: hypothetical protein DRH70_02785 [Candidatus Coatesbacteria bacterium]
MPCGFVAVSGQDTPTPVLERLQEFALGLRMKPVLLKSHPNLGVGCIGDPEKDRYLRPLKNAETLGKLLVEAIT